MIDEPEMIDEPDCCLTRSSSWRFASDPNIFISRKIYAGMSLPSGTWLHFTTGRRGAQTFLFFTGNAPQRRLRGFIFLLDKLDKLYEHYELSTLQT